MTQRTARDEGAKKGCFPFQLSVQGGCGGVQGILWEAGAVGAVGAEVGADGQCPGKPSPAPKAAPQDISVCVATGWPTAAAAAATRRAPLNAPTLP